MAFWWRNCSEGFIEHGIGVYTERVVVSYHGSEGSFRFYQVVNICFSAVVFFLAKLANNASMGKHVFGGVPAVIAP